MESPSRSVRKIQRKNFRNIAYLRKKFSLFLKKILQARPRLAAVPEEIGISCI